MADDKLTLAKARRLVLLGAAQILDDGSDNEWLWDDMSDEDVKVMRRAFDELIDDLRRRAVPRRRAVKAGTR